MAVLQQPGAVQLPTEVLVQILERLPSLQDLSSASQVCRLWWQVAQDHRLWLRWCRRYWVPPHMPRPANERENYKERGKDMFAHWPVSETPSRHARDAFKEWYTEFRGFHEEYPRMKGLVSRLVTWLQDHSASTRQSLQLGLQCPISKLARDTVEHLQLPWEVNDTFDDELMAGLKPLLTLYHFYDGQMPQMQHVDVGLFGSYSCYGQYTSVILLPAKYLKHEEAHGIHFVVFAVCPRSGKYLALVIEDEREESELVEQVVEFDDVNGTYLARGTFFEFFEAYVESLEAGMHYIHRKSAISIFRKRGPYSSVAVTRGIEVRVASICNLEAALANGVWTYLVTIKYNANAGAPVDCQLFGRHWVIYYKSGHVDNVRGEGVVGHNPILRAETPTFSYCSIVQGRSMTAPTDDTTAASGIPVGEPDYAVSMEGTFEFQPGTLEQPRGDRFLVQIARFELEQPRQLRPL